jgi:DNA polymerase-3 subunit delta
VKLSGRDAARFFARPDPALAGILLYGADAMRVALRRASLVEALVGPDAAAEMRLTRMPGADLRRDPAALLDAVKAIGFFPGARAVLVEEAADAAAPAIRAALEDWRPGDAAIVVTAGGLGAGSALRKAFEAARQAVAIGIYADPPGRDEIEAALAAAGLPLPDRETFADLEALAQALDPGDFAQFNTCSSWISVWE